MNIYKPFDKYVLRSPINSLKELDNDKIDLDYFLTIPKFLQSVKLASPALYNKLIQWKENGLKNITDENRLLFSMFKYYTRSCMRCTPFGLFAGINVGEISDNTNILLLPKEEHLPHTRLDTDYLCSLIQDLEKKQELQIQLTYYPNNTLYEIGSSLRYLEYSFSDTSRNYQISAVDNNEFIKIVTEMAKNGASINQLSNGLVDDEISHKEAIEFIHELISNQILKSNLEPTVTGIELHDFILKELSKLKLIKNNTLRILEEVRKDITKLDNTEIAIDIYDIIAKKLKPLGTKFNPKYLFQTDLLLKTKSNSINSKLVSDILKGLKVINKLTSIYHETNISRFKDAFLERYENREVPLVLALDVEAGIGFLQNGTNHSSDNSPLIDDLILPNKKKSNLDHKIRWSQKDTYLFNKYIEAKEKGLQEIVINDEELIEFSDNWDDLPSTISVITELITVNNETIIIFDSAGGSSAANLIGRFAHADKHINNYIEEIVSKEQEIENDVIHAEIVHLPENRIGNIVSRPIFREYEIPFIAQSTIDRSKQIHISDIIVSVENNRVILKSRKHNKEIKPHLTNAHNFSNKALPIYQFLSEMQTQNQRGGISFSWGDIEKEYDYMPRVIYKNIILSPATWIIKVDVIENIIIIEEEKTILEAINTFKITKKIPNKVVLSDGDNELYINLENILSIKMLFSLVKKRKYFKLKEFLFSERDAIVKDVYGNPYTNQAIFSFYKPSENNFTS